MNTDKDIKKEQEDMAAQEQTAHKEADTTNGKESDSATETGSEGTSDDGAGHKADMRTELEKAQDEIAELKDKYLRSVAEFDNYRKRTLKEKTELILNGSEKAVQTILPIIDDMERAISSGAKTDDPAVLREGMELIFQKFGKVLEGMGVKKIDTKDADFCTDYHEAIAMVPGMGDDKKGKVLDCVLTGYTLNDKVIRHAKVAVGQ